MPSRSRSSASSVQLGTIDAGIDQDEPILPAHRNGIGRDPLALPDSDAVGHLIQLPHLHSNRLLTVLRPRSAAKFIAFSARWARCCRCRRARGDCGRGCRLDHPTAVAVRRARPSTMSPASRMEVDEALKAARLGKYAGRSASASRDLRKLRCRLALAGDEGRAPGRWAHRFRTANAERYSRRGAECQAFGRW